MFVGLFCFFQQKAFSQFQIQYLDTLGVQNDTQLIFQALGDVNGYALEFRYLVGSYKTQLYSYDSTYKKQLVRSWSEADSFSSYGAFGSYPAWIKSADTLFFMTEDFEFSEIWRTDGTASGTKRIARLLHHYDTLPKYTTFRKSLRLVDRKLIFNFPNGELNNNGNVGRSMLCTYDLDRERFDTIADTLSMGNYPIQFNGKIYINMGYVTDGTLAGTRKIKAKNSTEELRPMVILQDRLIATPKENLDYIEYFEPDTSDPTGANFVSILKDTSEKHRGAIIIDDVIVHHYNWNKNGYGIKNGSFQKIENHGLIIPDGSNYLNLHFKKFPQLYGRVNYDNRLNNGKYVFHYKYPLLGGSVPAVTDFTESGTYPLVTRKSYSWRFENVVGFGNVVMFYSGLGGLIITDGTVMGTRSLYPQGRSSTPLGPQGKWRDGHLCYLEDTNRTKYLVHITQNGMPVKGVVFHDKNGNGRQDSGEPGLFNQSLKITPGNTTMGTDQNGMISGYLANRDGNVKLNVPKDWKLTSSPNLFKLKKDSLNLTPIVFGIQPKKETVDLDIQLAVLRTHCRRGKAVAYVTNNGTSGQAPKFAVKLDSGFTWKGANVSYTVNGTEATFQFPQIPPFQTRTVRFEYQHRVNGGDTIHLSTTLKADSFSTEDSLAYVATCAFDPNDKAVTPISSAKINGLLPDQSQNLKYTIRFENVGNDTAYSVTIYDTLDKTLDPSTVKLIGSSHPVSQVVEDGVLKFHFEGIELPHSKADSTNSQGHIVFTASPKAGYRHKTEVANKAAIVFDMNPPIVTNAVKSILLRAGPVAKPFLNAKPIDNDVEVKWEKVSEHADSLVLERSVNDTSSFIPLATLGAKERQYLDEDLDMSQTYFYRITAYNPYEMGRSNVDTARFKSVLIHELERGVHMFPNPASQQITMKMDKGIGKVHVLFYDNNGREVFSQFLIGTTHLDISFLSKGLYQIHIVDVETGATLVKELSVID